MISSEDGWVKFDVALTSKDNPELQIKAAIRDDGSFHFEYLPGGVTYTLKIEEAAEGRTNGSADSFMGITIPKQEILHKYGTDTTDITLSDADIDTVRLTVLQTDWTPPVKKSGAADSGDPADSFSFSVGSDNKP